MSPVVHFAIKDLRLLSRDRIRLFLTAAWPLLIAVFFGAFGPALQPASVRHSVAIVTPLQSDIAKTTTIGSNDRQRSNYQRIIRRLEESGQFAPFPLPADEAHSLVARGQFLASLTLTEDQPTNIDLVYAPDQSTEAKWLEKLLSCSLENSSATNTAHSEFLIRSSPLPTNSIESASLRRPPNTYSVTFPQGILWAVMSCAATFAIGILAERNRGTLDRLRSFPLSIAQILGGKALACFLCILTMETVLLAIGILIFSVRPTSWAMLAVALLSVAIAFVGIMMLIAVIGRNSESSNGLAWAILMVMAMVGGAMLPIFLMPDWMKIFAHLSPVGWSLTAIEGALWREHTWLEQLPHCTALIVLGGITWYAGTRLFSRA